MKKILSVFLSLITILYVCSFPVFSLVSGKYSYIIENGRAVITGYSGTDSALSIPSMLGGYSVFAIGEGAFKNNKKLTSVILPEGVCEVRADAFYSCTVLSKITLPSTILRFGENAIKNTAYYNNKSNWTVRPEGSGGSGGITIGGGQETIPWEFIKASKLSYLYLGTVLVECFVEGAYSVKYETTVIADGAFSGEKFKECNLSSNIVTVGARAFKDCVSLSKITLNDRCKIYDDAFLNTSIYNNPSNWINDFLVIGGRAVASKKDAEELVAGDGITCISNGIIGTKNVYLPESVECIDIDAFSGKTSVIYGFGGSYAESFANENGFKFVDLNDIMLGDMDFDGTLSPNDYAIYHTFITCSHELTKYEEMAADLTADGAIDAFDAIYLQLLINDKTATVKGDVNGDGKINGNDYIFLLNVVKCSCEGIGENYLKRADINSDGTIDAFDVIYLDLYLHGKVRF